MLSILIRNFSAFKVYKVCISWNNKEVIPYQQFIWSCHHLHFGRICQSCYWAKLWGENSVPLLQCLHI